MKPLLLILLLASCAGPAAQRVVTCPNARAAVTVAMEVFDRVCPAKF